MHHLRRRIIGLLIDEQISDREFSRLSTWLRSGGLELCLKDARQIRQILAGGELGEDEVPARNDSIARTASKDAEDQIKHLLLGEAGLLRGRAIELLVSDLGFSGRLPDRISFDRAIQRMIADCGPSSVLSAAQRITNLITSTATSSAWPLKNQTDADEDRVRSYSSDEYAASEQMPGEEE